MAKTIPQSSVEGSHRFLEIIKMSRCSASVARVSSRSSSFCEALVILASSATIASTGCRETC